MMLAAVPEPSSVVGQVLDEFDIEVRPIHSRFEQPGWTKQGVTPVQCPVCESGSQYVAYRKHYPGPSGPVMYRGLVCLVCRVVVTTGDLDETLRKQLNAWDARQTAEEFAFEDRASEAHDGAHGPPAPDASAPPIALAAPAAIQPPGPQGLSLDVTKAAHAEVVASQGPPRTAEIGAATPLPGQPGVYRIASPTLDISTKPVGTLFLSTQPSGAAQHNVTEVRTASQREVVVAIGEDEHPAPESLMLYGQIDPGRVAKAFYSDLSKLTVPGLAAALDGQPLKGGPPLDVPGLNSEQQHAAGAIVEPGVCAVWGPPGTGKTQVIGFATAELVKRGHSVAIVSNTNVAVDQALLHVSRHLDEEPVGCVVRVGYPSIPEVVDHPSLTIRKAVQILSKKLTSELEEHRRNEAAIYEDASYRTLKSIESTIGGRSPDDLAEIERRASLIRNRSTLESALHLASKRTADANATLRLVGDAFDNADAEWTAVERHEDLLEVDRDLTGLRRNIDATELRVTAAQVTLAEAQARPRLRRRRATRVANAELSAVQEELTTLETQRDECQTTLNRAAESGITPERIRSAKSAWAAAESDRESAKAAVEQAESEEAALTERLAIVTGLGPLTDSEEAILDLTVRWGSVAALLAEVTRLGDDHDTPLSRLKWLLNRINELEAELKALEAKIVSEAQVVGTTLAQLVMHPRLVERTFDYLIIDEASAALPPYAYAALTKASIGAALVGDFEQNGPISQANPDTLPADISKWLTRDLFSLIGIADVKSADADPGCVALRRQYRFGEATMRLVNEIAYDGLLVHGTEPPADPSPDAEIVFVNVEDLGDLAQHQTTPGVSGRWSGASVAIVDRLLRDHEAGDVGIVTPYAAQASLMRARLRDAGLGLAEAGTAHRFQGREFPIVILDMVQDAAGSDWIARSTKKGNKWQRAGVRVANVAISRNSSRLYIIGHLGVVQSSAAGPLAALRRLIADGMVEMQSAAELLSVPAAGPATAIKPVSTASTWAPTLLSTHDFYPQLLEDLGAARSRVVIFSPFVAPFRFEEMRPELLKLVERGVGVVVMTKDPVELKHPKLLDTMHGDGVKVYARKGRHEKVVIIDDSVCYVGSLNVLSNRGATLEMMLRFEGPLATAQVTDWMRLAA